MRIRIKCDTLSAISTKITDVDTGEELRVRDLKIKMVHGIWEAEIYTYLEGLDIEAEVTKHIVKCAYCKREESLNI